MAISNDLEASKVAATAAAQQGSDAADGDDAALVREFAAVWKKSAPVPA